MDRFAFAGRFTIGDRPVGEGAPVFIIAEAGVAHFGSLEKALALVDLAAGSGADAVKFQVFTATDLISKASPDWIERLSSRELPREDFIAIRDYCAEKGILFFATAHDAPSLDFLAGLDVPVYKVGSGEVRNWPFLEKIAKLGKPVIFSTGMYEEADVAAALAACERAGNREVGVLHCVTAYPTPPEQVNLSAVRTLGERFGVVSGYSDHTAGFHFPLAAVAMGAKILEKHITIDFNVPNAQDWKVSCGPDDLAVFVRQVREIEAGLGTGEITVQPGERESLKWAGKSLVAARPIRQGEKLTADMLVAKRPGGGVPPSEAASVVGKTARLDIAEDEAVLPENLS